MKPFIHENFMLQSETAVHLFHNHAKELPIIDYHCHLDPKEIADDHKFRSITELWLGSDHYKWRILRANGVAEKYITGNASDWDKFLKWAETMPYCMRNPLYHWTHLELKTCFGIDKILNPDTAREIYDECNEKLQSPEFTAKNLMLRYNVETVCTTDDPVDSLEYHKQIRESGFKVKVLPTWRPDAAMAVENPAAYREYIDKLAKVSNTKIECFDDIVKALLVRHKFFEEHGCRLSDHGMEEFYADDFTASELDAIFKKVYGGTTLTEAEIRKFKSAMLIEFGKMDADTGWTQQFHYGVIRNNNTKMFKLVGKDTGFDSISQVMTAKAMNRYLDRLNSMDKLAKTIIYNLCPTDFEVVCATIGNFQDGSVPCKLQLGAAWWFLDQKYGIEQQMNALSMLGLLSRFVGMLTDSRSFVSYTRHEYFRRIMCNLIAADIEKGEIPASEMKRVEQMVEDISYYNAKRFFNF
ncbi:MAG: glucuronate isomerase [Bacteroidaceae bacterium]|jgi:glucuronate isomerase|nr:glucuronate isomerase [Bacteroidaceae bacterium]NLA94773.1 glucuronate isomerase [Bacteroidales bacterium]HBA12917.1 glucuronate isomerase [Bacteroidales bacterium]HOD68203.1 glucuronate isomerase [Bacteroidaceae bacterium]HQL26089.1 glucuronate isomerase [Bacteroidaceae bacterium]